MPTFRITISQFEHSYLDVEAKDLAEADELAAVAWFENKGWTRIAENCQKAEIIRRESLTNRRK